MTDEDALRYLIEWLRAPKQHAYGSYGYDFYLPNIMRVRLAEARAVPHSMIGEEVKAEDSPHFYAAAWELCRRGILRPGIRRFGQQATADGASGNGYSVTPYGRTWLAEADRDDFVPAEPERFGALLKVYEPRFGLGFSARGQEAVRCYGAHAYLACCAMCGASAESILLATAIAKMGDEAEVLKVYVSGRRRSRVEGLVFEEARGPLRGQITSLTGLVGYCGDDAAHGRATRLGLVQQ